LVYWSDEKIIFLHRSLWRLYDKLLIYKEITNERYIIYIHPIVFDNREREIKKLITIKCTEIKQFDEFKSYTRLSKIELATLKCSCCYYNNFGICTHIVRFKSKKVCIY
jgi:hypothetical protein